MLRYSSYFVFFVEFPLVFVFLQILSGRLSHMKTWKRKISALPILDQASALPSKFLKRWQTKRLLYAHSILFFYTISFLLWIAYFFFCNQTGWAILPRQTFLYTSWQGQREEQVWPSCVCAFVWLPYQKLEHCLTFYSCRYMIRKLYALASGDIGPDNADSPMCFEILLSGHLYLMFLKVRLYTTSR